MSDTGFGGSYRSSQDFICYDGTVTKKHKFIDFVKNKEVVFPGEMSYAANTGSQRRSIKGIYEKMKGILSETFKKRINRLIDTCQGN